MPPAARCSPRRPPPRWSLSFDGVAYEARGRQELRNVREPVELVAAVRAGARPARSPAVDPVCQMAVDPGHAAGRLVYRDTAYFFCTLTCAGHFAPDRR